MACSDPWDAVLEVLARPIGRFELLSKSPGGLQTGVVEGGNPFGADLSTVRCIKERSSEHRWLYYLTFDAVLPNSGATVHPYSYVLPVERGADGKWGSIGGAGGGGKLPPRAEPWVNLAGGYGGDHLYAGGLIDRAGADIHHVRLRFADGWFLEDDAEHDVALFLSDTAVVLPAMVELYGSDDAQVASHAGFPSG